MTTALLIIDVQQGLCDPPAAPFNLPAVLAHINDLAARARAAHAPVIFIQHASGPGYLEPHTPAWALHRDLHRDPTDLILPKTTTDAFHRTDLHPHLQRLHITHLVTCGMHSEFCVDVTTRRALALGYTVTLAADAHTTEDNPHLTAPQIIAHTNYTLSQVFSFGPRATPLPTQHITFNREKP